MKKLVYLIAITTFFTSCRNEKIADNTIDSSIKKADHLSYNYDSVKVYSKNIAKTEAVLKDTTKAVIKYPVFKNQAINKYIHRQVLDYFSQEDPAIISYPEIANSFIRGYDSFFMENKETQQSWFLNINIKVLKQTDKYIALEYTHSDFSGGAHGNTSISYLNYNPQTNQPISIDSLIDFNQKPKLLTIAESIFRKNEKLSATEPLADKYFFEKGKFTLAQNFYVSDKGLVFLYNPYEIKAYAYGTTTLVIPFAALKAIAKPNSILTSSN